MQVKVLSIKNPYAYLIIQGGKDVENRTWTIDYRGRLYIHVSGDTLPFPTLDDLPFDDKNNFDKNYINVYDDYVEDLLDKYTDVGMPKNDKPMTEIEYANKIIDYPNFWLLKSQSIIGYVDLVDIIQNSSSPWSIDGQYHWILKNPTLLENPIRQVKGRLGLWNYNLPE